MTRPNRLTFADVKTQYYLSSNLVAVVSTPYALSFIRNPGDRDDDALRALVGAPELSTVMRIRQDEPTHPDLVLITFPCHICGEERFDAQISVAYRWVHTPDQPFNLRYCNDRERCVAVATVDGPWPPEQPGDWCIPQLDMHADPHRGCAA